MSIPEVPPTSGGFSKLIALLLQNVSRSLHVLRVTGYASRFLLSGVISLVAARPLSAGTWTQLSNSAPSGANVMILLSDGSVMAQGGGGASWYRLKPDSTGSYLHGTWNTLGSMHDTRQYYSLQVLQDGRLFVAGGEYGTGGSGSEVYDPVNNTWTSTSSSGQNFVDSISEILPNGKVMVAPVYGPASTVIYDPVANTWATGPSTLHGQDEVPWIKLRDGSLLCVDGSNQSERYIPSLNKWVADAGVPVALYSGGETGSGHLLANGKALFRGYTHTALYTPSGTNAAGTWVAGPDVPGALNCGDTPGAVMVNGNVLFCAGPGYLTGPTSFVEYDATANTIAAINGPTGATYNNVPYGMKMLTLPDGSTLVNVGSTLYEYVPTGAPLAAAQPTITSITHNSDGSYHLVGTLLNGISEGSSYGDDFQMATNYPILRLTSGTNVYYARTYNWSSTGVQTGTTPVSTEFRLPLNLPAGTYSAVVTANGIASSAVTLTTPDAAGDIAPTVATAASSTPSAITTTADLAVLGADSDGGGEANLIYTWAVTAAPTGISTPSLSANANNAAKSTTATFHHAGSYTFAVTITDSSGLSATSAVSVTVSQSLTSVNVTPATGSLTSGQSLKLSASGLDQFGITMTAQPTFTWAVASGTGTVNSSGLYTSPASGTLATVTATTGTFQDSSVVSVVSSPWISEDIGSPAIPGSAYDSSGIFTVNGEGSDIWGTSDQFHYVYRPMNGDGIIIAHVLSQTNTAGWAKAGVMIRETNAADSAHAMMVITPSNGTAFQWRPSTGSSSSNSNTTGRAAPYWVKLVRQGSTIRGYSSSNGTTWTLQSSGSMTMGSSVLVGLAVDSANTSTLSTVAFDNVSILAAQNDSIAVNPGNSTSVNVLANDSALTGTTLSVTSVTQGTKGSVTNNGAGSVTYSANASAIGIDSFTCTITDSLGNATTSTVHVVINGLQAYYKFEEGSGTAAADSTGDGYTCALTATGWGTGIDSTVGGTFNGSSGYGEIPAMNLNTNTMTITGWVYRNGAQASYSGLVFNRAGSTVSGLHFGTANELRYTWKNSASTYNYNSHLTVPDATWTFVALVVSPTNAKFYMQPLGGAMTSATNSVANAAEAFDGVTDLGSDPAGGRFFNGTLDEVRIYNTSLTSAAITALASASPSVATTAAGSPATVSASSTGLSVLGASNIFDESTLTYSWAATSVPSGATAPTFSANATNAAKNCTATFTHAGSYTFTATVTDPASLTATSNVIVTVNSTPSSLSVAPASTNVVFGSTKSFACIVLDQFGTVINPLPAISWNVNGGGTIDSSGQFTSTSAGGPFIVTATSGAASGTASVTVTKATATVTLGSLAQTYDGTAKPATATTSPAGKTVSYTYNGSGAVPTSAGSYTVVGTISDMNYQGAATDTLVISKATATVTLASLSQTYDGTSKSATAITSPPGLTVTYTFDGSSIQPVNVGSYVVLATVADTNYQGSATDTLQIHGESIETWRARVFTPAEISAGAADDSADPDGDGLTNLAEYALGTNPHEFTPSPVATLGADGLTITFTRPKDLPDVNYVAESSEDMVHWSPLTIVLEADGAMQTMRAVDPLTSGNPALRFVRLRFTR